MNSQTIISSVREGRVRACEKAHTSCQDDSWVNFPHMSNSPARRSSITPPSPEPTNDNAEHTNRLYLGSHKKEARLCL